MTDIVERLRYAATSRPGGICEEAADEITRLRAQMETQKDEWLFWAAKRAALEQDAARYRWMRENGTDAFTAAYFNHPSPEVGAAVDAAIDAAMKA